MIFCNGAPNSGREELMTICSALGLIDSGREFVAYHDRLHCYEIIDDVKTEIDPFDIKENDSYYCLANIRDYVHYPFYGHKFLLSLREPRNMLISYLEKKKRDGVIGEIKESTINNALSHGLYEKRDNGFTEAWTMFQFSFFGWVVNPYLVHIVNYEDLSEVTTIDGIANFLGITDYDARAISDSINLETYDYNDYFTSNNSAVWLTQKGENLIETMEKISGKTYDSKAK